IKYTGFRDRPHEERQARFQNACRDGRSEVAFVATGTNLSLQFFPANLHGDQRQVPTREYVDFDRETGKVHLKAPMILNGVCVIWRGWIDLQRLDGMGFLEYDEERAQVTDGVTPRPPIISPEIISPSLSLSRSKGNSNNFNIKAPRMWK
ncbi:Core-binding factor subunit beta, partial [Nibea albiflora]